MLSGIGKRLGLQISDRWYDMTYNAQQQPEADPESGKQRIFAEFERLGGGANGRNNAK